MKWIFTALAVWLLSGPVLAQQQRYWDTDYDSLAGTLLRQRTDTARLRTLVHLVDLRPTGPLARPRLAQLLALNQRLHTLNDAPYRRLNAGLALWDASPSTAALDTIKAAVTEFDRLGRPIPWLLIDIVTFYNRLNHMEARKRYYDERLVFYRMRGADENMAACHVSQGAYYRRRADYNRAVNSCLRAADLASKFSNLLQIRELLVAGAVYADWGNTAKAEHYLRQAQAMPNFKSLQGMEKVFTYLALSRLDAQQGEYGDALRSVDSALGMQVPDPYERQMGRAYALVQKAAVLLKTDSLAAAEPLLQRAQALDDSLHLPMSGKPGEFELDATWAQYYAARRNYAQAEAHWQRAYQKATAAKLDKLRPRYLKQLAAFYEARHQPAEAMHYAHSYIALTDTLNAAQNVFHVGQYESERIEQAQNAQIAKLQQAQAVQAERLRLGNWLLFGALLVVLLVSGLGVFIYRQLRVNRHTLAQLREAQSQLVQAEKMAFLGELTAGIAHELQNPLDFMKNFAEVSTDLVDDMKGTEPGQAADLGQKILAGLKQNLQQISQHGQRASSIIKDMLEHSRSGTSQRTPSDLNALTDESLALAYRGLQARDKSFQATLSKDFDPKMGVVAVVAPDLGRVLLNLCTNALYAVRQRQLEAAEQHDQGYQPTLTVSTRRPTSRAVEIRVRDNGIGMSEEVLHKVFQPFFTTKAVGEGTGLGLSLSYDIVTKGHGGTLTVESQEGQGTEFVIRLPV